MISQITINDVQIVLNEANDNPEYLKSVYKCARDGLNGIFETMNSNANTSQLHLDILQAVLNNSPNHQNVIYLSRSEQTLSNLTITPSMMILPNRRRLCVNSTVNNGQDSIDHKCIQLVSSINPDQGCPYYKKRGYGDIIIKAKLNDIEEYKHLLRQSRICPYYFELEKIRKQGIGKKQFLLCTQADLFNDMIDLERFDNYLANSIIFFDNCSDFSLQLEKASSVSIDTKSLKVLAQEILGILKQQVQATNDWQQKFYQKHSLQFETTTKESKLLTLTQEQMDLACPIISFINKTIQLFQFDKSFQNLQQARLGQYYKVSGSLESAKVIQQNTENFDKGDLQKFCFLQGFTLNMNILQNMIAFSERKFSSGINEQNYEAYIQALQKFFKERTSKSVFQKWINFLYKSFRLQESSNEQMEINSIGEQESDQNTNFLLTIFTQSNEAKSLNGSFQKYDIQEKDDYRLIIEKDIDDLVFQLQCLNPQIGIRNLKERGVQNIIITSAILSPMKLYEAELGIKFDYKVSYTKLMDQINIDLEDQSNQPKIGLLMKGLDGETFDLQKVVQQRHKFKKSLQNDPLNPLSEITFDNLIMSLGKTLVQLQQMNQTALLVLFTSKSFMNQCNQIWTKQQIITSLSRDRSFNWIEPQEPQQLVLSEGIKLFLNRTQNYTSEQLKIPTLITQLTPLYLESFQDAIKVLNQSIRRNQLIFQNKLPITCVLIGVPWANASLFGDINSSVPQVQYDTKMQWLKHQVKNISSVNKIINSFLQYDPKTYSLVHAIRTIGQIISILSELKQLSLILIDEQFSWKHLWKHSELQKLKVVIWDNIQQAFNQLTKAQSQISPSIPRQFVEIKQMDQPIQANPHTGRKRKIMLNRVLLGDKFFVNGKDTEKKVMQSDSKLDNQFSEGPKRSVGKLSVQKEQKESTIEKKSVSPNRENRCCICWSNGSDDDLWKSSHCSHLACWKCWETWLEKKLECPLCRKRVRQKFLEKFVQ